jgi:two-component system, OmpR family, KDP operon response regulator KdpE
MANSIVDFLMAQPPTADKPLLGVMMLVVEDSRYACEALRLLGQRSGARIRRAESLASAGRHLAAYRPRIVLIDLGLPDGSGLTLVKTLSEAEPRINAIVAISGDDSLADQAIEAGADLFLAKPIASLAAFQTAMLGLLDDRHRPSHPVQPAIDGISPDPIALRDDLGLIADLLRSDPDARTRAYAASFLFGLGKCADDPDLIAAGHAVSDLDGPAQAVRAEATRLAGVVESCMPALLPV